MISTTIDTQPSTSKRWTEPSDISNCVSWWRADVGVTTSGSDVTSVADLVGSNDLAPPGGSEPTLSADEQNGRPGILFDGTQYLTAAFSDLAQPVGVLLAFRWDSSDNNVLDSATSGKRHWIRTISNLWRLFSGSEIFSTVPRTAGLEALILTEANGASSWIRGNGTKTSGNAGTQAMNGIVVGGRQDLVGGTFFGGAVFEVALFQGGLTDAEAELLEETVNARWKLY